MNHIFSTFLHIYILSESPVSLEYSIFIGVVGKTRYNNMHGNCSAVQCSQT